MSPDCQRWAELADLDALGEPSTNEARVFQVAHEATCRYCAHEAAIWRATQVQQSDAPVDDAAVEKLLFLAAADRARRASSSQRWKGALYFLGGSAACAAAILFWISTGSRQARLAMSDGQAHRASAVASQAQAPTLAPTPLPVEGKAEPSCSQVVPGATVCLASGAVLGRRTLSVPQRELEVVKGRAIVALAPQAPGTSFSLTTASGKVTAVGTIFSVEVSGDGGVIARVVEGKVLVRARNDDTAHPVHAGLAFRLGDQQPTPLSDQDRDLDIALLSTPETDERDALPAPSAAKPPAARGFDATRPRDTLEYARSLRRAGDSRGAAEVYRKIHADNPQSLSGRAALVSLGELLLSLGDAPGALSAFNSYLVGGGELSQEASFGRIRALRASNRTVEEQQAIRRFLEAYPNAPQSRVLRVRLAAIEK